VASIACGIRLPGLPAVQLYSTADARRPEYQVAHALLEASALQTTAGIASESKAPPGKPARNNWIRSNLFDPLRLLQPPLPVAAASIFVLDQLPVSDASASQHLPISEPERAAHAATAQLPAVSDGQGGSRLYFGLPAASNQRTLRGSILPSRQHIRRQVDLEYLKKQQQRQQQMQTTGTVVKASGSSTDDRAVASIKQPLPGYGAPKGLRSEQHIDYSSSSGSDPDGDSDASASAVHRRWIVPTMSSAAGYVGGLYDQATGTMYLD